MRVQIIIEHGRRGRKKRSRKLTPLVDKDASSLGAEKVPTSAVLQQNRDVVVWITGDGNDENDSSLFCSGMLNELVLTRMYAPLGYYAPHLQNVVSLYLLGRSYRCVITLLLWKAL